MALLCKNCAGTLIFDPEKQKLICKICEQSFDPEDTINPDMDLSADESKLRDARIYICNHCGSEIELNGSESSSFCIYCGNPAIVFSRIAKTRRPDRIIPFKVTREQAEAKLIPHLKNSFFLNRDQKDFELEKIRGIYIPYWRFSGTFYAATEVRSQTSYGGNNVDRFTSVKGRINSTSLPVYGSDKLPTHFLNLIDNWDFSEAVDFDEEYLSGFYSDVADIDFSFLRYKAENRYNEIFKQQAMKKAKGRFINYTYDRKTLELDETPEYLMVPVWFLTLDNHDGTRSTFLMNAQSGVISGSIPGRISRSILDCLKITGLCALITFIAAVIIGILYVNESGTLPFSTVILILK